MLRFLWFVMRFLHKRFAGRHSRGQPHDEAGPAPRDLNFTEIGVGYRMADSDESAEKDAAGG